jgi:hypothetical protein
MMKDKNIDELFRSKLGNFEQEPPAYVLENVLAGVAGARRKRKIIFWRITGVAAALLLAFVAGWQFNGGDETIIQSPVVVQSTAPEAVQTTDDDQNAAPVETPVKSAETLVAQATESISVKTRNNSTQSEPKNQTLTAALADSKISRTTEEESLLLKPIKSLTKLLQPILSAPARILPSQQKQMAASTDQVKSIDQQIMEQNQRQLLVQDKEKGKWSVGAQVSPAYNVSHSSHAQTYASNMISSSSSNPVDLGGGVSVQFKKGKRWSLQSGVYYSGLGQSSGSSTFSNRNLAASSDFATNVGKEYFNAPVNIDASSSKMLMNSTAGVIEFSNVPSGMVLGTNLEDKTLASNTVVVSDARFIQNFEYIEVPLYLRYIVLDSKFDVEMVGGFSSNILVGNDTYMESAVGRSLVGSTKDMETMNYSGTLGVGFKYGISRHLSLNVEPRVKYFLNSLNSNSSVTYKPYTIGVFTGLSYEF